MTFELNSDYNNIKSKQERNNKTIIVELASIDEMPISVHFFLELVSNKIWDDTIFIHHEQRDHVIAVPPISYTTQRPKTDEMKNVGWTRLGYPEYSNKYPHKKYTIGFANQGPTFYINTMDNTENHGPNGQQHHLLAGEGDPCFGTIVGGLDAIDEIIQFGLSKNQQSLQKISNGIATNTSGAEDDPLWTRFIKAEII